jgi:uncharacterized membrane protein YqjE
MNPPRRGLFGSARSLLGTALELLQVRLALFANDFETGTQKLFDALALAMLAWLGISVGTVLLCALVLILVQDTYRIPVLLVMALGFLAVGAWALAAARRRLLQSGTAFDATRAELRRDLAALTPRDRPADASDTDV